MTTKRVKLVGVTGHQEEFADLIGASGELRIDPVYSSPELNWFGLDDSGIALQLCRKKVTEVNGEVIVHTKLKNTFTFKLL